MAFKQWPHGTVASARWLHSVGIPQESLFSYKHTGWVRSIGHGGYVRSDDNSVDWIGAIYALQQHYEYTIYPGARSALSLYGKTHYLRLGVDTILLLTPDRIKNQLPSWFKAFETEKLKFRVVQSSIFSDGFSDLVDYQPPHSEFSIKVSSKEQALLEMLSQTQKYTDLDEAFKLLEFFVQLDVEKMNALLLHCTSVKAKRLFMVIAKRLGYDWLARLNLKGVDFGAGPRHLVSNGVFDKEYRITVPKDWYNDGYPEF